MATTITAQSLYRNEHHTVPFTASGAQNPGDVVAVGDGRIGLVAGLTALAANDPGSLQVVGQFDLLKNSTSDTFAVGDPVYFDSTAGKSKTTFAAGYLFAGRCVKASASGDVYVYTDINVEPEARHPYAAVVATGSTQADATSLAEGLNAVTAADATKGVKLPTAKIGMQVIVKNVDNAVLKVYPATGGTINVLAGDAAISMAARTPAIFVATSATQWYTIPLLPS